MKKINCFYILAILIAINSFGQTNHIEFDHYTTNDGLSNGYINAFLQDSKGFIWIGTANGLNRFNGISFKSYYVNPKDSTSIPGNGATSLAEDMKGNIWVMSNRDLCVYDRNKDCFIRKKLKVNGVIYNNVNIITSYIDSKGYFWIGSYNGIFRFKLNDNESISDRIIDADQYSLVDRNTDKFNLNVITSFVEDESGKIWTANLSNTLFYFDSNQNKFISQTINLPEINSFTNNQKGMLKDSEGDIFITIEHVGLLMWDKKNNQFKLFKPDTNNTGPKGDILFSLGEDQDGLIWIGDRATGGISIFNKKTMKFSYCQSQEMNPFSLNTNKINCIYRDKSGSMWVGTIMGVNKYSPGKSKFARYFSIPNQPDKLSFNNTLCFAENKSGDIWIGTDGGGLNKLDRKTGKFTHYVHNPSDPNSLSSNAIISMIVDHEGTLWMGTYNGGLAYYKDDKFSAYYPDPNNPYSLAQIHTWDVMEDSKQNLWVATLSYGLELFDRKTNRFYQYINKPGDSTSIFNNGMVRLYEDSKQRIYITTNLGVSTFELNDIDFTKTPPVIKFNNWFHDDKRNSLSSNNIYCVKEDNAGDIWFGNIATGLDKLDRKTGLFINYTINDGLPGNSISSILVDSLNNLWLATDKGLARFNPKTKEVVVFDQKDGLQNKSLKGYALKTKDGEMFFGGTEGFNSFYPERMKLSQNKNIPPVVITGLKIFNKPVKIGEDINGRVILSSDISETRELVLTYKENYFTFEFIALDYTTPEKNNYAYKMEGFDDQWVQSGTKHEANYTNLDPGKYTFRVKGSNNDGIWNQKGTSIKVIILPPWWETWWFRLLAGFILIFAVAYISYSRVQHFKNQKILLEQLVAKKTSELQEMNAKLIKQAEELNQTNFILEERQEQIEQQSEELSAQKESLLKMNNDLNELNATKDKFFSIIAHDIKNPFNAILGFTELLQENFKDWTDEMKLEIINLVLSSSKNLYQLLENLLNWSRSQRGIIEFKPQKIEFRELMNSVIEILKGTAEAKNIVLGYTLPDNGLEVFADRQMLDTIMRNLISNAIKFTNSGGKVHVNAEKNDGFIKINVSDNGVGIRSDMIKKLFRIESNLTTPGTANETGTGLGLILVKEFVNKHGGEIWVESEVGHGSEFIFTLKLK